MAEKVIFEFQVVEGEGGSRILFKNLDEVASKCDPEFLRYCSPRVASASPTRNSRKRTRRIQKDSQRRLRKALDFLEQMHTELYGSEDS
ncbi:MAG: hypothetical protein GTO18_06690 [Anaerolineales bacterium]|nr:hypothetical protein [Anaerolineales bacterium]